MFLLAVVCLFVCRIAQKLLYRFSQNSMKRWRTVPRKKPLDVVNNPGHVALGLGLGYDCVYVEDER